MSLEQEKEERKRLLDLKQQTAVALDELERTQRSVRDAAASLTDIHERIKALGGVLIADEEGHKRIHVLQEDIATLTHDVMKLKREKNTLDTLILQRQQQHDDLRVPLERVVAEHASVAAQLERHKRDKEEIVDGIEKAQSMLDELVEKQAALVRQNAELEKAHAAKIAAMDAKEKQMAQAFADLKVYEQRLRREYGLLFPDVAFKNPLDVIKEES